MEGYLYILQSKKNGSYYIGSSIDTANRLEEQNGGKVTATRYCIPWEKKFEQKYSTIREARQIEYRLKKMKRRDILERIIVAQQVNIKIKTEF